MSNELWLKPDESEYEENSMYLPTTAYKLIYIYEIDDDAHKGLLKIGEASIATEKTFDQLTINCRDLNKAAKKRIGSQTGTAGINYHLVHTEIAVREKGKYLEPFKDKDVHSILERSGIRREIIPVPGAKATEWFQVDLATAKNAITACKEGRKTLLSSEIVSEEEREIVLREEQEDAIKKTINCFKTDSQMLWNAKMRYGKTATALTFVKREQKKYPKTIIITHRPVVEGQWRDDFNIVFRNQKCLFLAKDRESDNSEESILIDLANEKQLMKAVAEDVPFLYFASIQDLRGSKKVGGKFDKNNAVFNLNWDLVINDEAHEGTQTELGLMVANALKKSKTKLLSLSGTPFNIINQFDDDSVYTWDYPMEQAKKREWDLLYPGDPNPYADLPQMHIYTYDLGHIIKGYSPELEDKAFNFTEFFRTWTEDSFNIGKTLSKDVPIGEFVHRNDVKHFLDLLATPSEDSAYPFSNPKFRDLFHHTLWMVPGVKEALALEKMLREHPIFKNFKVANVAGEGDFYEDFHYDNALDKVRNCIKENDYTITLSCGKLTTGVTVREWTACFMLSGSYATGASSYLQTVFRVQSPGQIDGKAKEHSYVFDFAPDRTLVVLAEAAKVSRKGGSGGNSGDDKNRDAMRNFLNFCPVISINGTQMKPYSVDSMMEQLKKVYAERAIRTGFEDASIYNERLMILDSLEIKDFEILKKIIGSSRAQKQDRKVKINDQGFTEEEYEKIKGSRIDPKEPLTPEKKEAIARLRKQREERGKAISILRGISVRMPLLIFGADVPFEEDISIERFVDIVDNESWREFMPNNVTKELFQKFAKYYDRDVFIAAGKEIRKLTKRADTMLPTQRVQSISKIFSYFKNPDKETVLTPWRVVNLHISECLGGYNFWDEDYAETIENPRFVDKGEITAKTLANTKARILEINSKTGLYPLYVAYSIYRAKCKEHDGVLTERVHEELWNDTVKNNIYIICKSEMAKSITKRTLLGYKINRMNAHYFDDLINQFSNKSNHIVQKILKKSCWNIEGVGNMRFDAIVGNPPYQEETVQQISLTNGQAPRKNVFQFFQIAADQISSLAVSLIYPGGRWIHRSGKGMAQFGYDQINDIKLRQIHFFPISEEIFKDVQIGDGISIVFKDKSKTKPGFDYIYHKDGTSTLIHMNNPGDELIPLNPSNISIIMKVSSFVSSNHLQYLDARILPRSLFGIESDFVEKNPSKVRNLIEGSIIDYSKEIKLFANDKAGKAGRASWFIANRDIISNNSKFIDEWQVVVSSANAGGQKRDNQIEIIDNHSAFARSRVALCSFETKEEAVNFFNYAESKLIKFMFLMTDESLTSLGKKVPDLLDYTNQNMMLDFSSDINTQLYDLVKITKEERTYIEQTLENIR